MYRKEALILKANQSLNTLMDLVQQTRETPFLYKGRDTNHKDVLYHLVGWHDILLDLLNNSPKPPIELRRGFSWHNLEALNYQIQAEGCALDLDTVIERLKGSHQSVLTSISKCTSADLNTIGLYPFTGHSPLGEFVHECLEGHYHWAIQSIQFLLGDPNLRTLLSQFSDIPTVQAITLGGSKAKGFTDAFSDYDIYVYTDSPIDVETRKKIINPYVSVMEYNHQFFETEDDGILKNGVGIEFIYRNLSDFEQLIHNNLDLKLNRGYSTCFIDHLVTSKIVYDRDGLYQDLQTKVRCWDKTALYQTVINQNIPLLYGTQPNMLDQIVKAVKRTDVVAINHRLSEYLSLFFDTLFALNQRNHPGEKRLLAYANACPIKPKDMVQTIEQFLKDPFEPTHLNALEKMTVSLIELTQKH